MKSVLDRIKAKINLLESWVELGIPNLIGEDGVERPAYFPTSLNKARLWEDEELGVEKIGDPGSFTTVHRRHGSKVVELDNLIKRIKAAKPRSKPPSKSLKDQLAALRQEYNALEKLHKKVVSQLAAALEEVDSERTQRMSVERVLADQRRMERVAAQRAGKAALEIVRPSQDA